ncbi:MAG: DUF2784 domain-containing protein [Burkholderiales bacterium]|nr:DUF2784 domain-containing protein [Burkholderiales bacterium]
MLPSGVPARLAADAVLLAHAAVVVFIVGMLLAVAVGAARGWGWVRHPWLRAAHLAAIALVAAQAWLGRVCPLTSLEMALRAAAGERTYAGAFVAHWVGRLLYYDAPLWVFALAYTAFGALVAAAWILVPPRPFRRPRHAG